MSYMTNQMLSGTDSWREHFYRISIEQENGGHRSQRESALEQEAMEHLFHLSGGRSMLDFGCGSADVLAYTAARYDRVVGVDIAPQMLANARSRLDAMGVGGVQLVEADDRQVWDRVEGRFDRITGAGVVQFLRPHELEQFLVRARERLEPGGTVVLLDAIDPLLFSLWSAGSWKRRSVAAGLALALARTPLRAARRALRRVRGRPGSDMGYAHSRREMRTIARRAGFRAEIVSSMRYEYRYHVILSPR